MKIKVLISALVIAALTLGITGATQAANSTYVVKLGVADVVPKSSNGTLNGGALGMLDTDIDNSVRPSITFEYLITPNIGVELLAAWPFRNDVNISNLGGANVASVDILPPTLSLQYHFLPDKIVSPFVGVGVNYSFIYNENTKGPISGMSLDVDDSWGFAAHVGVDFNFNEHWLMTVDARWIQMGGDVKLNGAKLGKVDINPMVYGIAVGYRF